MKRVLYFFTRTPLHVGAGASVGAIDQPIIRERHTGFPIIPASALKGTFADCWNDGLLNDQNEKGESKRVRVKMDGSRSESAWLFGSDSDRYAAAGALQFSEARLLAFPIRSAKGSFAWITCPHMLRRAVRDEVITSDCLPKVTLTDEQSLFASTVQDENQQKPGPLRLDVQEHGQTLKRVVLEEYTFAHAGDLPSNLGMKLAAILTDDPVWQEVARRIVILSDGMMSFFAQNACEVAQHVKINDETGTAERGALFNQENVPSETLFYSVLNAFKERTSTGQERSASQALEAFETKVKQASFFQFGGDASTGLGYCTVKLS